MERSLKIMDYVQAHISSFSAKGSILKEATLNELDEVLFTVSAMMRNFDI